MSEAVFYICVTAVIGMSLAYYAYLKKLDFQKEMKKLEVEELKQKNKETSNHKDVENK